MIAQIHAGGGNFAGAVAYLTHDAGTQDDPRPTSDDRVGFIEVENLVPCDPARAARIMAATVRDADALKALAGVSAKGRKLTKPVYHFSLSWAPDENPARAEMLSAAQGSLQSLGMGDRQAVVIEHCDRPHPHVHVVVNRVSPEDGRAASTSHDARTLSTWAAQWEREHGGIRCRRRIERNPDDPDDHRQRRRGPGRRDRSPDERKEWAELYGRQKYRYGMQLPEFNDDLSGVLKKKFLEGQALERAQLARSLAKLERQRQADLERQRADAEEAQREADAERTRRRKALGAFPGAYASALEQFDQIEPGWREAGELFAATMDQVLDDLERAIDKSLDKQEENLEARLREWDDQGVNLLARARTDALGSARAPAGRQERAQVLDAADRLDMAERAIWGVRQEVEERHETTPAHRSLQAAAAEVVKDSRMSQWGRDIAGAISSGAVHPGYADPGSEGETEQLRERLRTVDEESAAQAAEAANRKAGEEHAGARMAWEQLSLFRRAVTPKPKRRKPKTPTPTAPPTAERIESYRDSIVRIAERVIRNVIRHFQPQLDPERRSETFQNEMRRSQSQQQQPAQNRTQDLLR